MVSSADFGGRIGAGPKRSCVIKGQPLLSQKFHKQMTQGWQGLVNRDLTTTVFTQAVLQKHIVEEGKHQQKYPDLQPQCRDLAIRFFRKTFEHWYLE